jgi:hypothetical protein
MQMYFFKRVLSPWMVRNYDYVHFVDSDAGSPADHPFDLWEYEKVLKAHDVPLGQPSLSAKTQNYWPLVHQNKTYVLRWTSFVENVRRMPLTAVRTLTDLLQKADMLPPPILT